MHVDVAFLPPSSPPLNRTCLVVDVLRATSSLAVLLGRGLEGVYPASSIEAARSLHARLGASGRAGRLLLCGERNALPPEGFDLGNSPSELARLDLPWTEAVMATTNGTPALLACLGAPLVLAAASLNAAACVEAARHAGNDVLVVAAGSRGEFAEDDALAAGYLVHRLVQAGATPRGDARRALAMIEALGAADGLESALARAFRSTEHGRSLVTLGFEHDLDFCAQADRYAVAPVLVLEEGTPVLRPFRPSL